MRCGCRWLRVHFHGAVQAVPLRAAMCPRTAVAVGPRLVRRCARVRRSHAHPHTHTRAGPWSRARAHVHALCMLLQKSHVLQEPWRGGGETYDKR